MGLIADIVQTVEELTKITQDRAIKENKTFREILDEELKKIKEKEL